MAADRFECRPGLPLSVALGAGSVRGMAHVPVLEALIEAGFRITEIAGASVGALVAAAYAALGMELDEIRKTGLGLTSGHLISWGLLRHAPERIRRGCLRFAGTIPGFVERLAAGSFQTMHHGVERIGLIARDRITGEQVVCHNVEPVLRLEDAVRGAVALPGLFPAWKCAFGGRSYCLFDGGIANPLPLDILFEPPFRPVQIVAVDISARPDRRARNLERVAFYRSQFPAIPIDVLCIDTFGGATVGYRSGYLNRVLEAGRQSAAEYVARLPRRVRGAESLPG